VHGEDDREDLYTNDFDREDYTKDGHWTKGGLEAMKLDVLEVRDPLESR
jgi:hypothetical protein